MGKTTTVGNYFHLHQRTTKTKTNSDITSHCQCHWPADTYILKVVQKAGKLEQLLSWETRGVSQYLVLSVPVLWSTWDASSRCPSTVPNQSMNLTKYSPNPWICSHPASFVDDRGSNFEEATCAYLGKRDIAGCLCIKYATVPYYQMNKLVQQNTKSSST